MNELKLLTVNARLFHHARVIWTVRTSLNKNNKICFDVSSILLVLQRTRSKNWDILVRKWNICMVTPKVLRNASFFVTISNFERCQICDKLYMWCHIHRQLLAWLCITVPARAMQPIWTKLIRFKRLQSTASFEIWWWATAQPFRPSEHRNS